MQKIMMASLRGGGSDGLGFADASSEAAIEGSEGVITMRVEGADYTAIGTYKEIDAPSRLVYTWDWKEEDHSVGETLVTVEFEAHGDATEIVLLHEGFPAVEAKEGHEQGWGRVPLALRGTLFMTLGGRYSFAGLAIVFLAISGFEPLDAQSRHTEHTVRLDSGMASPPATLADVAWIQGHWRGPGLGGISEEFWMEPSGGCHSGDLPHGGQW